MRCETIETHLHFAAWGYGKSKYNDFISTDQDYAVYQLLERTPWAIDSTQLHTIEEYLKISYISYTWILQNYRCRW